MAISLLSSLSGVPIDGGGWIGSITGHPARHTPQQTNGASLLTHGTNRILLKAHRCLNPFTSFMNGFPAELEDGFQVLASSPEVVNETERYLRSTQRLCHGYIGAKAHQRYLKQDFR